MIRAVLFDLDGTLVDTEAQTDRTVAEVLARFGAPAGANLPAQDTHGHTWTAIARTIVDRFSLAVTPAELELALAERWDVLVAGAGPIPGAEAAVAAAAARFSVGVVSSSSRAVIGRFLTQLGLAEVVPENARVGAEDVTRSKPDPDAFLVAAKRLGVEPHECLVFEDSRAGLEAARAAGMNRMAVLFCAGDPELICSFAGGACGSYHLLPERFWDELAENGLAALGVWR